MMKIVLDAKKLNCKVRDGYLIDKFDNRMCKEESEVRLIGQNIRGFNKYFIFKYKEEGTPHWFELLFADVIDQVLAKNIYDAINERIDTLNELQQYYQEIGEDDDEEYEELINERNTLEEIIYYFKDFIKIRIKDRQVEFLAMEECHGYNAYELLDYYLRIIIEEQCEKYNLQSKILKI